MLQQEVVLQGEAAVLVVQLSQEVVEANGGQRVLEGDRVPEEAADTELLTTSHPCCVQECRIFGF